MLDSVIAFLPAHEAQVVVVISGVFSLLSLLLARWPWASKLFGAFAVADLGRALRFSLRLIAIVRASRRGVK